MFKVIKKLKNKIYPSRVPANLLLGHLQTTKNNVPPEQMASGVTKRYRELNDPMYRSKSLRKKFNNRTKYDIAEDKLMRITTHIINSFYNYPFKWIPLLNKKGTLFEDLERLKTLLQEYSQNNKPFVWKENNCYDNYLDYNFEDTESLFLKKAIEFLDNEETRTILNKCIEMDEYISMEVDNAINRIVTISERPKEDVYDRIDFFGYK